MWLDSSFSLTVEAETSEYQPMQEFACRVLTTLAQDLSKKKAFPVKFSCAQFYLNNITDTWPNKILFPGESIEVHSVCVTKLEHPGVIIKSTAQSQFFNIYILTQFSHILAAQSPHRYPP